MKKIPVISTVKSTLHAIQYAARDSIRHIQILPLSDFGNIEPFFKYEMPEVKIIDFGDPNVDAQKCLDVIRSDSWLLFGGVLLIVNTGAEKRAFEEQKDPNVLLVLVRDQFEKQAKQIINMLTKHTQFLFNRGLSQTSGKTETGRFVSNTDPFEIIFYAHLISNYLYNTDRVNKFERDAFQGAMMELLLNAVEHGNCNITYAEKSAWLEQGRTALELVAKRLKDPKISKKQILIAYTISEEKTTVTIRDEGNGFDWKKKMQGELKAGLHGMGINLTKTLVKNLRYNDRGNEVSFDIDNQKHVANFTPLILRDSETLKYTHLQVVMREGDIADSLFYIAKGRFAVYVSGKLVSVLSPSDIFIGEMAMLLNNRRSATVVAIGNSSLVKISKADFMAVTEQHPHYGIFLSRLLASRLMQQSRTTVKLKSVLKDVGEYDAGVLL